MAKNTPNHPGKFIKQYVLPKGISTKEAAALLDVGRPALSNLLNGNADLSQEMAARLQKAFNADPIQLMALQTKYDEHKLQEQVAELKVQSYVPQFLKIRASDLESWAGHIPTRTLLPVLVRKLVNSTGVNVDKADIPGYDSGERRGWDGFTESTAATPWIPVGKTGWEIGTSKDPLTKAEKDYGGRTASMTEDERKVMTFVFITPRKWNGKTEWEKEKQALGEWKSVRAYDASDLEQWLEQSIPAQIWLSEELGSTSDDIESLEHYWINWSKITEPHLDVSIFKDAIELHTEQVKTWLTSTPSKPLSVAADSRGEALAFLYCLLNSPGLQQFSDRGAIFHTSASIERFAETKLPIIQIIPADEVQVKIGNTFRQRHTIVVVPKNTAERKPDVVVGSIGRINFQNLMELLGKDSSEADRLARESGYSATILRRRLAVLAANRSPSYAKDASALNKLRSITLIGGWHSQTSGDQEILAFIADKEYELVERDVTYLVSNFEESPVWSLQGYHGVISKLECLFALKDSITIKDLENFFFAAKIVLSESDPSLELPEEHRHFASLFGKKRNHSAIMRKRICETLVLLAVHGEMLFKKRLGIDVKYMVDDLVKFLMTPLTLEKLLSQNKDLTFLAEASPEIFIEIIEADLRSAEPATLRLMKPASTDILGPGAIRTDMLWSLEALAWNPDQLPRIANILGRFATKKIDDNYVNKPITSLKAIFRSWLPQTAATIEDRKKALGALMEKFPSVGWEIIIDQFDKDQTGQYSHKPRWRNDATGFGQRITQAERVNFAKAAFEMALSFSHHTVETWSEMIQRLLNFPADMQSRAWDALMKWVDEDRADATKAILREKIRTTIFTFQRFESQSPESKQRSNDVYNMLLPADVVYRHQWLFNEQWLAGAIEGLDDDHQDWEKRDALIMNLRLAAIDEIWTSNFETFKRLALICRAPRLAGWILAKSKQKNIDEVQFIRSIVEPTEPEEVLKMNDVIYGFLGGLDKEKLNEIISHVIEFNNDDILRIFLNAPCEKLMWDAVHSFGEPLSAQYWQQVRPSVFLPKEQLNELVDHLLEAGRPRAAFDTVQHNFDKLETSRLKLIMQRLAFSPNEAELEFSFTGHDISSALKELNLRPGIAEEEMADIEFVFIRVLEHSEHGIPNLQRQVIKSPFLFFQAVAMTFRRHDEGEDPQELGLPDMESRKKTAMLTYTLLEKIREIPGRDSDGSIKIDALRQWISEARSLCQKYSRTDVGDQSIGKILSSAPLGDDGIWPCEPVRKVLEESSSPEIAKGVYLGRVNSRGPIWGVNGMEERELASMYLNWARQLAYGYPFVSKMLRDISNSFDHHAEFMGRDNSIYDRLSD